MRCSIAGCVAKRRRARFRFGALMSIALSDLEEVVALVKSLPNLSLRGLMAIPAPQTDMALQREVYAPLQQALLTLQKNDPMVDTLSIGMSGDLAAAIASGSTMVRVGTAIFGARQYT